MDLEKESKLSFGKKKKKTILDYDVLDTVQQQITERDKRIKFNCYLYSSLLFPLILRPFLQGLSTEVHLLLISV